MERVDELPRTMLLVENGDTFFAGATNAIRGSHASIEKAKLRCGLLFN
jgi:hypothetical protein